MRKTYNLWSILNNDGRHREEDMRWWQEMERNFPIPVSFSLSPHITYKRRGERERKTIGGIVRGILYLHEDSRLRVKHRDLKVSNILLDDNMNPKISDFGMAKMLGVDNQTYGNTTRVVGT